MTVEDLRPMPWKPGQSGNPNGRPKSKPMTDELKTLLSQDKGADFTAILKRAITEAKSGDFRYFKEIIERIDGKVIEQIDLTADVNVQDLPGLTKLDLAKLGEDHDGPE